jgi:hypothetical protein
MTDTMVGCRSSDVTIFTGVPRSGTTMLGELANRYLDVGAENEGPFELWLAEFAGREARLQDGAFFDRFLHQLAGHLYFRLVYRGPVQIDRLVRELRETIARRTLEGVAVGVLELTARHLGRSRLGHEDPQLIHKLDQVLRVLPGCRIVHIVRDPRDTAASILRFAWGANNAVVAARDWKAGVERARRVGTALGPDRYLEVRYEDVLGSSRATMASLMRFVCADVDPDGLARFVAEMEHNPRRGNSGTWRHKLSSRQAALVEACAGETMRAFGYEPEMPPVRLSAAAGLCWKLHHRAVQVRNIVAGQLQTSGEAVPEIASREFEDAVAGGGRQDG